MAEVILTKPAKDDAKSIYQYYDNYSHQYSEKLMKEVITAARRLEQFPEMGPKEQILEHFNRNYRSVLVLRRYKLIYLYENQVCSILMVWDTKESPALLKNSDRFKP